MRKLVRSPGTILGLLFGGVLLAAGCAGTYAQAPPQTPARGAPNRSPVAAGVIVIVTDQTGRLLGAAALPEPVADPIMIKRGDLIAPEDIEKVTAEKVFLAPGVQTITIFGMGDPCQYVIQGGRAVKKCW
jgi:hypothetical protein